MNCNNKLYIPLFILLVFILIVINCTCKYSYKPQVESFRNNNTFGYDDKNSKYLFACVDKNGNLNQYYVPGDGSMWGDAVRYAETGQNKPSYVLASEENSGWGENNPPNYRVPGINCTNDNNSIFKNISINPNGNINDANSFGGGTNSKQAVINLQPTDITAENFANSCTKERWYLFKHQGNERKYIYAVFKRKPWINNLTCCNNNNIQRNGCYPGYEDINGSNCNDFMKQYCRTGNNITNETCDTWCSDSKNSETCKNFQYDFCNKDNNFTNNIDFCNKKCINQKCDIGAANYCKNNLRDNNFCACFLDNAMNATSADVISALDEVSARLDPVCFSSVCRNGKSYQTQTMKDSMAGCPKCLQKMSLENLSKAENIKQSCNVNTESPNTQIQPTTPVPIPASVPTTIKLPTTTVPTTTTTITKHRTMSDYLDSLTNFLNSLLDSISNLFNN